MYLWMMALLAHLTFPLSTSPSAYVSVDSEDEGDTGEVDPDIIIMEEEDSNDDEGVENK